MDYWVHVKSAMQGIFTYDLCASVNISCWTTILSVTCHSTTKLSIFLFLLYFHICFHKSLPFSLLFNMAVSLPTIFKKAKRVSQSNYGILWTYLRSASGNTTFPRKNYYQSDWLNEWQGFCGFLFLVIFKLFWFSNTKKNQLWLFQVSSFHQLKIDTHTKEKSIKNNYGSEWDVHRNEKNRWKK